MVNYLAKFCTHVADFILPMLNLLKKDIEWSWSESQHRSFDDVKELVSTAPVLSFCNPAKELTQECDASEYGVGAAMFQNRKLIVYTSRTLSETERQWAQIEKEMVSVSFGLKKLHVNCYY